jgi:hypothetical protein
MMKKLKERWNVSSNRQLTLIFIVFAITGSASAWLSRPLCEVLGISKDQLSHWYTPVRLLLIFPIYQALLVTIGALFGQFTFFWNFEKKLLRSLKLGFLLPKEPQ